MTQREAEKLMLAYRRSAECTVGRNGYRIVKYHGTDETGSHFFECIDVDIENPKHDDYIIFEIFSNGRILPEFR